MTTTLQDRSEAAEYYHNYIDQVPKGEDIRRVLEAQLGETVSVLDGISESKSLHRYASDKWSIREVVGHINDAERVFVFRALWFARGLPGELPSFDQDAAMAGMRFDDRALATLVAEFRAIRESSLHFFRNLPDEAWSRRGIASGNPFTVRALAHITAGHAEHHMRILRERYL
jgi:Mycothiol maleylpyruvate isomerase N-terminal domain.